MGSGPLRPCIARSAVAALALGVAMNAGGPVGAAEHDPAARLKAVEREIAASEKRRADMERKAERAAHEIRRLKKKLVRIAEDTQRREAAVSRLEAQIDSLGRRVESAEASLRERRGQMVTMLAALERIARHPPVALASRSDHPVDTIRSAILIRSAVPAIEIRSDALRAELSELFSMREELSRSRDDLLVAMRDLDANRETLAGLIEEKARLERSARAESRAAKARSASLAAEAKDLKDLLARLEADRIAALERERRERIKEKERKRLEKARIESDKAASRREQADRTARSEPAEKADKPDPSSFQTVSLPGAAETAPDAEGGSASRLLSLPARGKLVRRFGDRTRFGRAAKGLSIETRPAAQIVAPRDGEVLFAGPFRRYGQLLIIRHEDGRHVLLSGMAQIHAAVGDQVLAGEPVGIMGGEGGAGATTLYIELRHNGQPVNPLPWLTATRSKVSG